jgi:hypothetical protein
VPKITAIRVRGLTYDDAIRVPVVSLMSAVSSAGTSWGHPVSNTPMAVFEKRETHMSLQAIAEHRSDISAFGIGSAETLGPANEFAMIDALLAITRKAWVGNTPSISVMTRLTSMGTRTRDVLRLDSQLL